MVFLKLYTVCIFESKPTVGKAKIKNLVSFSNLVIVAVLAFSSIISVLVFLQNSLDKEGQRLFFPCTLSLVGNTLLTSFLVRNKEALEYTKLKLSLLKIGWNFKLEKDNMVHPGILPSTQPRTRKETNEMIELALQERKTDSGDDVTAPNMSSIQV